MNHQQAEVIEVDSVDATANTITLKTGVQFLHYGSAAATVTEGSLTADLRAVVSRVTRDIVITKDQEDWGCRVVTTKFEDFDSNYATNGETVLQNVRIDGCGKKESEVHSLEFLKTSKA